MPGTQPVQRLREPVRSLTLTVGTWDKHEVEVTYGRTLRLLRIRIDGKVAYSHCGRVPWSERRAREFKTPGREAHTFVVEPPGAPYNRATIPGSYIIWLDGRVLLRVERD